MRANDGVSKLVRRRLLQRKIFLRAQAGVDREHDRKRQCRLPAENRDLLFLAVFFQREVFFLQAGNRCAVGIGHGYKDVNQFDINFEGGLRLLRYGGQCGSASDNDQDEPKVLHAGTIIWMRAALCLCQPGA